MKKVLIITYYWPPSGGGGVMRWLKMSKYLPGLGWKPIIYTPENPDASVVDESLAKEIHPETEIVKTPIWEPYEIFRKLTRKKKGEKFKAGYISEASSGDWKSKLSVFIRGNFLIPDPRKFWIKPSIRFLSKYLEENPVDLIVSTGPPHSMHLIALELKKKFDTPWIADFRDPWTDIDFYNKLRLTKWADKIHRNLELEVLEKADHVVTVSPNCANDLTKVPGKRVEVINNGFDPEDFEGLATSPDEQFSITHFGAFNRDRNPAVLWKTLGALAAENHDFKEKLRIRLIGQTDDSVIQSIEENGLKDNLIQMDHLPHKKGLAELAGSQVLLLPINDAPNARGILPGKMYEYMALRRPILAIGPTDSDFAQILAETNAGAAIGFNDSSGMKAVLNNYFMLFREGKLQVQSASVDKYSRKNLAQKFISLVEK
ncbi:Glycosyltransferase involved in cell wall bisynthesis [Mariniphaga anaerophila]|uniref:Glycosyltransferase involved in cell wall bisynthesis n=1 Tax=Mariniphaga anaerophila TaxID=1484053 RepID=A0A1M5BRU4_9BACT|nr:glycosyltransferase family 4 protein [Mariniphaga anaerophila]SHF45253.1 Glycosyltransferase involved in cell wall bisynthesis [Mariniphaga anaerophila]